MSNVTVERVLSGNKDIASSRIAGELVMKRPGSWSLYKCKAEDLDRLAPEPKKDVYVLKVGVGSVIELDLNLELTADQAREYMDHPSKADAHAAKVVAAPEDHFHDARSVNRNVIWDDQKNAKVKQRREGREVTEWGIIFYKAYADEQGSNTTRTATTTTTSTQ